MQSVLYYGRILSRAVANGVYSIGSTSGTASSASSSQQQQSTSPDTSNKKFRLLTAVSGFAKHRGEGRVTAGKYGDDAYFVARHQMGDVIGVADGVGGWRSWGIDPGVFSTSLMSSCERLITEATFSRTGPRALLARAYSELETHRRHILGSSTACIVVVRSNTTTTNNTNPSSNSNNNNTCSNSNSHTSNNNASCTAPTTTHDNSSNSSRGGEATTPASAVLHSANIGDSGYLVVRGGAVVHRSREQQHYFNTPFQLSLPPLGTTGQVLSDSPARAESQEFAVEAGDLLLVATDGVFDNLPMPLLLELLQDVEGATDLAALQSSANVIAQQARERANDEHFMSPFAINARQNGIDTKGGKPDDITVVLATIMG